MAAAKALYPEWSRRVGKEIRPLPKNAVPMARAHVANVLNEHDSAGEYAPSESGSNSDPDFADAAHACDTDDDASNDEVLAAVSNASRKITSDDICTKCGGRGHWSIVAGKKCLTDILGNKIPHHELQQTKYPNGLVFPNLGKSTKPHARNASEGASASSSSSSHFRRRPKSPRRPQPKPHTKNGKKPFKPRARNLETENSAVTEPEVDPENDSDDSGDESSKIVQQLAFDYYNINITPPPSPPQYTLTRTGVTETHSP